MTDPSQDDPRVARRRHEHERQAVVFGVIIAFLAVCGILALLMYTGSLVGPFHRDFTVVGVSQQKEVPAPCLPAVEGQPDGALPLPYSDVRVNALNASEGSGVAQAFKTTLVERGFTVLEMGNVPEDNRIEDTEIRFGHQGIVAAYTLAAQFPSIRLVLDDRTGKNIDLLIGTEYDTPIDIDESPIPADEPLENADDCVPAAEIQPEERIVSVEKQAKQAEKGQGAAQQADG